MAALLGCSPKVILQQASDQVTGSLICKVIRNRSLAQCILCSGDEFECSCWDQGGVQFSISGWWIFYRYSNSPIHSKLNTLKVTWGPVWPRSPLRNQQMPRALWKASFDSENPGTVAENVASHKSRPTMFTPTSVIHLSDCHWFMLPLQSHTGIIP